MNRCLISNADDFGMCRFCNQAVFDLTDDELRYAMQDADAELIACRRMQETLLRK